MHYATGKLCLLELTYINKLNHIYCFSYATFKNWVARFESEEGGLNEISQSYKRFGLHRQSDNSITYREYAPGVVKSSLIGEFSILVSRIIIIINIRLYSLT